MTPNDLPRTHDRFVGRQGEVEQLRNAIQHHRLVTLVGPGGAGKTRLAVESARLLLDAHPDGAWFVPLGVATTGDQVVELAARAVGHSPRPGEDPIVALCTRLQPRHLLLVVDNCEHLLDPVGHLLSALLEHCPDVHLLATSRSALRLPGERLVVVEPLAVDEGDGAGAAVELFLDRATAVAPGIELAPGEDELVREVCHRLDGLPLALELAAARLRVISLAELAERLDASFGAVDTRRGVVDRHQTLEAAVAWSYDLLDEAERTAFRFLAVFPGDVPLAAIESVLSGLGLAPLESLTGLVDKSLVVTDRAGPVYRYRLLESVRGFGRQLLEQATEVERANTAVLSWVLGLVDDLERDMRTPRQDAAIRAALPELATIRAAYEWCLANGQAITALRILSAVPLMPTAKRFAALDELCAQRPDAPEGLLAQAHLTLGNLAFEAGEHRLGIEHSVAAATAFDELGEVRLRSYAREMEAFVRWSEGDDLTDIRGMMSAARADFEAVGDRFGLAHSLWPEALLTEEPDPARRSAERSVELFRELDAPFGLAHALEALALIELDAGHPESAVDPLAEALTIFAEFRNGGCIAHTLEATAALSADRCDLEEAGHLVGAAEALRADIGQVHRPWERRGLTRTEEAFARGDRAAIAAAVDVGRSLAMDDAVAQARALLERPPASEPDGAAGRLGLTTREAEVMALLAEGATNQDIAARLFLSVKTVERHLGNLYRKLGVANRTQAAAIGLRNGIGRGTT